MKWLAFTAVCVATLVTLGVLAVDERDTLWEGRSAFCPYCRAEMRHYSLACRDCGRTVDWTPNVEPCRWCLDADAVEMLRSGFRSLELRADAPMPEELAEFPEGVYFTAMEPRSCAYCAGVGGVKDRTCPVCRGTEKCVGCAGDGTVLVGDRGAHERAVARRETGTRERARAELLGLALQHDVLLRDDVDALAGYAEAEELRDETGDLLLAKGRQRAQRAFAALKAAHAARTAETAAAARE